MSPGPRVTGHPQEVHVGGQRTPVSRVGPRPSTSVCVVPSTVAREVHPPPPFPRPRYPRSERNLDTDVGKGEVRTLSTTVPGKTFHRSLLPLGPEGPGRISPLFNQIDRVVTVIHPVSWSFLRTHGGGTPKDLEEKPLRDERREKVGTYWSVHE